MRKTNYQHYQVISSLFRSMNLELRSSKISLWKEIVNELMKNQLVTNILHTKTSVQFEYLGSTYYVELNQTTPHRKTLIEVLQRKRENKHLISVILLQRGLLEVVNDTKCNNVDIILSLNGN